MTKRIARAGLVAMALAAGVIAQPGLAANNKSDPVAAIVNGTEIRVSQVAEFQRTLPPQMARAPYPMLLDALINYQLVSDAARKEGLQNDPEVKRAIRATEDMVLRKAWMQKRMNAEVTDSVIRARYDQFVANFKPEEEIHARHILVDSEDAAKSVISDLNSGVKFEDLAKSKSKDPSAQQNGGDLGWFTKNEMVPEFTQAAFAMKPGQTTSQPVKTQFGWHVIKVEEKRMTSVPSYEEAKPILKEQIAQQMAEQSIESMRSKAKIKRFNPDGSPMSDEPAKKQ